MRSPAVIDLFSGAGGLSLGAHLAGFETALAIDVDKDLTSCFHLNFPNTKLLREDLSVYSAANALEGLDLSVGELGGVIGGPPCQGFSVMGHRNPDDPRNSLIGHFFQFVKDASPAFFVMENVPNILDESFKPILEAGIAEVAGLYKIVGPMILDAADFGAATVRRRMVIIGYRPDQVNSLKEDDILNMMVKERATVYDAIHDLPSPTSKGQDERGQCWATYACEPDTKRGKYAQQARSKPQRGLSTLETRMKLESGWVSGFQPTNHTKPVLDRWRELTPGKIDKISKCRRLAWGEQCTTLRAGTGKDRGSFQSIRPIHPTEDRVITIREAARIQGFPDWFQFHPTRWHSFRMIGNSVSPLLSRQVLGGLIERMKA